MNITETFDLMLKGKLNHKTAEFLHSMGLDREIIMQSEINDFRGIPVQNSPIPEIK